MIICLAFIIIGAVLLAFALAAFRRSRTFVRNGKWVEGTVTELLEMKGEDGLIYSPIFEIVISDNEKIRYEGANGSSLPSWKIGQKAVFVHVAGESPAVRRLGYWSIFWLPVLLLSFAADFIVVGAGYFLLQEYFGR
jgi:hypothetical protein